MREIFFFTTIALLITQSAEASRLKDISNIRGVRENQLIGYGLIVGLNGTGDGKDEFTSQSFSRMLDTIGVKLNNRDIETKNVAAVIVTATLPPFARSGNKIDVTLNSIGHASSLQGGTLLQTPLRAADGTVYAVAQGALLMGSTGQATGAQGSATQIEKVQPTVARIPNGAMIETDMATDFADKKMFRLTLKEPDFTTVTRVVKTINQDLGGKYASAKDSDTVDVIVPFNYEGNAIELLASIENLDVSTETKARVVINEKTGTVVIGERVQLSTIAISHGNLTVQVKPTAIRGPASDGNIEVGPNTPPGSALPPLSGSAISNNIDLQIPQGLGTNQKKEKGDAIAIIKKTTSVGELVKALNSLGVTPKDLITILQTIKAAGALHGDIEVL